MDRKKSTPRSRRAATADRSARNYALPPPLRPANRAARDKDLAAHRSDSLGCDA